MSKSASSHSVQKKEKKRDTSEIKILKLQKKINLKTEKARELIQINKFNYGKFYFEWIKTVPKEGLTSWATAWDN